MPREAELFNYKLYRMLFEKEKAAYGYTTHSLTYHCCDGGTGNSEFGKAEQAEYHNRIENYIYYTTYHI